MSNITNIEDYTPHCVIETDGQTHVVPMSLIEGFASGDVDIKDHHKPIIRKIIKEWVDYNAIT